MTDEELKKKAEEYQTGRKDLNYFSEPYKDKIRKAYIAGAKELQKENEQLKQSNWKLLEKIEEMKSCFNCSNAFECEKAKMSNKRKRIMFPYCWR